MNRTQDDTKAVKPQRVMLIYPYSGRIDQCAREIISAVLDKHKNLHTSRLHPILVINRDTINRGSYNDFSDLLKENDLCELLGKFDVVESNACDTCMNWIDGMRKFQRDAYANEEDSCLLQIPGDLSSVKRLPEFADQLRNLGAGVAVGHFDFAVGDFNLEHLSAKELIDIYGTYPLLYNWFPEIARKVLRHMEIQRPRTEFFAANVEFISEMLTRRKFAYEQTLAFLIYAFSDRKKESPDKEWRIGKVNLGFIEDYYEGRGFREATDQIERMERLLKLIWREQNGNDYFPVSAYRSLDQNSTSIREAAMVSLENVLKPYRASAALVTPAPVTN